MAAPACTTRGKSGRLVTPLAMHVSTRSLDRHPDLVEGCEVKQAHVSAVCKLPLVANQVATWQIL